MRFKELLKGKDRTPASIARLLGLSRSTVSLWCRDRGHPKIADITKIANFLNVSVEEILECFE